MERRLHILYFIYFSQMPYMVDYTIAISQMRKPQLRV